MSGPYFFPVYASKVSSGVLSSYQEIDFIFQAGFALAGILIIPLASYVTQSYTDERTGTVAAAIFYGLGALSTTSSSRWVLYVGRGIGNIGTGLMAIMPEAWLSSELQKVQGADPYGRWLCSTFTIAYSFDSVVAIVAGQLANTIVASNNIKEGDSDNSNDDPTGPFMISPLFLCLAAIIVVMTWTDTDVDVTDEVLSLKSTNNKKQESTKNSNKENDGDDNTSSKSNGLCSKDAIRIIFDDPKILMVGLIQCCFESGMYIFVLNQAPTLKNAAVEFYGSSSNNNNVSEYMFSASSSVIVPSGTVFCSFMACCLIGGAIYKFLSELPTPIRTEKLMTVALACATASLTGACYVVSTSNSGSGGSDSTQKLFGLIFAFFLFEVCVGMYMPMISWLRSKYYPMKYRSIIMALFYVPFSFLTLSISFFATGISNNGGTVWALASLLLFVSLLCLLQLRAVAKTEAIKNLPRTKRIASAKVKAIGKILLIRKLVANMKCTQKKEQEEETK